MREDARRRIPAAERREALIDAAVHEFAHGGLNGTPVDRVARRVGVAQPYVFSLFPTKLDLFLAAVERGFEKVADAFALAAESYRAGEAPEGCEDVLMAMGLAYRQLLASDRDCLLLQHQAYAACHDERVRAHVRRCFARLADLARTLSQADDARLDEFFGHGMALNVAAAMAVPELSVSASWVGEALADVEEALPG